MNTPIKYLICVLLIFASFTSQAQRKRPLDFDVYEIWNSIRSQAISNNGKWVYYNQKPQNNDGRIYLHDISSRDEKVETFERGDAPKMSADSRFLVFKIKPQADSLREMRRRKVRKNKMPKDSLGIYDMRRDTLVKVARVKSFALPEKAGSWLAYHLEVALPKKAKPKPEVTDSTQLEEEKPEDPSEQGEKQEKEVEEEKGRKSKKRKGKEVEEEVIESNVKEVELPEPTPLELARKKIAELEEELEAIAQKKKEAEERKKLAAQRRKAKKENKENGTQLVLRNLLNARQDTFAFVKSYAFDQMGRKLAFASTGDDSTFKAGVYVYDLEAKSLNLVFPKPGDIKNLIWDETGTQLAFVADTDTSKAHKKALIKYYDLYYWTEKSKGAELIAQKGSSGLPQDWMVSAQRKPYFSKDGAKLFFGSHPEPLVKDTTLLKEEIVKVDVWNWQDKKLQSQQNAQLGREKNRSYLAVAYPRYKRIIQLGSKEIPNIQVGSEGNADIALGMSDIPYQQEISWLGNPHKDFYIVNLRDGRRRKILENIRDFVRLSPAAQYLYWYSSADSTWKTLSIRTGLTYQLNDKMPTKFYDELYDYPDDPGSYGMAGWLENDASLLIYDNFDIWQFNPEKKVPAQRITQNGRENRIRYRYVRLDREINYIKSNEPMILAATDDETKSSGFFSLELNKNDVPRKLIFDDYLFLRLTKARDANRYMFTRQSFREYPDLYHTDGTFTKINPISNANPQMANYWWGDVEMVRWTAPNGEEMKGLLYKPENFDPDKKYPMVTYFYRRLSDRLHRHYWPYPSRSTVNPSMYTSNGYLVFMPDISYRIGHPGRSAYEAVVSGVTNLLKEGYIDRDKLGIQGQSWGGYQVAYIVTQTDLFAAAMAGAPVTNMFSAYGGIRWGSGMSRMFQYERSQSRIGATIWEKPFLYFENSPIFFADQIETPLLMMHNDNDGAVPWYQGIELFVALRRLQKPTWMLTYNGEQHNLTRWQNRKDLSQRMMQFFDYYLRFKPEPAWMKYGVPAIEKGIKKRYELIDSEE